MGIAFDFWETFHSHARPWFADVVEVVEAIVHQQAYLILTGLWKFFINKYAEQNRKISIMALLLSLKLKAYLA